MSNETYELEDIWSVLFVSGLPLVWFMFYFACQTLSFKILPLWVFFSFACVIISASGFFI